MSIHILTVGRKHESWISGGVERYQKRLKRPFDVEWVLLPHSARTGDHARQDESERIRTRIKPDDFVVLLDERGTLHDSPALSELLTAPLHRSQRVVIVIGGAYGVDAPVHARANAVWSLSPLVFPHQLVRLILTEQLYRSQEIAEGRPYHHE
ncbi:MAG: 23S rRNA (pseudouridine(1915)-N(3))-methyltransferase RlmH [Candidatus Saccharimonadales bacterium]